MNEILLFEVFKLVKVNDSDIIEGIYYSEDWAWIKLEDNKVRIGITDYAQKQLHEIVYVELPETGSEFSQTDAIGAVESVKAVSDMFTPISGTIVEVNVDNLLGRDRQNECACQCQDRDLLCESPHADLQELG